MGQPIQLTKGKETATVYGRHEAARYVANGWKLAGDSEGLPLPPAPINATDSARELAENHNIDLTTVKGTGTDGRIVLSDVKALISE